MFRFFKNKRIKESQNHETRLKEFLMTTFLIFIVYELIAKVLWTHLFKMLATCNIPQITQSAKIDVIEISTYM
jgi:hypothetical protein